MSTKDKIRQYLKEDINKDSITRIAVFDFDGTLVDTPVVDRGHREYREKTGKEWPHNGWWGRPESLDLDIFNMPVIPSVISSYNHEKQSPETLVVMLTGRLKRLSNEVEKILAVKGLRFDKYYYNMGGSTLDNKIATLDSLIKEYPNVKSVAIWDDRVEHIDSFRAWGAAHPELDFHITVVEGNHHGPK